MREASVLPGSGGRRWGCLKIPILHACPSAAAWRTASLTPVLHLALPSDRCSLLPSELQSPGFSPSRLVGLGCQDQGRSLVLVLTGSSWGNGGMDRVLLRSQPSPHRKRSLLHKVDSCQESPGLPSSRPACSSCCRCPSPGWLRWGRGAYVEWTELRVESGGLEER